MASNTWEDEIVLWRDLPEDVIQDLISGVGTDISYPEFKENAYYNLYLNDINTGHDR